MTYGRNGVKKEIGCTDAEPLTSDLSKYDLKDSTGANEVAYGGRPRGHNQSDEDETLPERELVHVNAILE